MSKFLHVWNTWKQAAVCLHSFLPAASLMSTIFKTGPDETPPLDQPNHFFPFVTFCTVTQTGRQDGGACRKTEASQICVWFLLGFCWQGNRSEGLACAADLLFMRRVLLSQELLCNSWGSESMFFRCRQICNSLESRNFSSTCCFHSPLWIWKGDLSDVTLKDDGDLFIFVLNQGPFAEQARTWIYSSSSPRSPPRTLKDVCCWSGFETNKEMEKKCFADKHDFCFCAFWINAR